MTLVGPLTAQLKHLRVIEWVLCELSIYSARGTCLLAARLYMPVRRMLLALMLEAVVLAQVQILAGLRLLEEVVLNALEAVAVVRDIEACL